MKIVNLFFQIFLKMTDLLDENSPGSNPPSDDETPNLAWNAPWNKMKNQGLTEKFINDSSQEDSNESDDPEIEPEPTDYRNRYLWCASKGLFDEFKTCINNLPDKINSILALKDEDGYTCLHKACSEGHFEMVEWIIGQAEHSEYFTKNNNQNLKKLLNNKTLSAWRPLHCASYWGQTKIIRLLARNELVEINSLSDGGLTPLHVLCNGRENRDGIVELLMSREKEREKDEDEIEVVKDAQKFNLKLRTNADNTVYDFCRQKGPYVNILEIAEDHLNSSYLLE